MRSVVPQPPTDVDPLASELLKRLRRHPEARFLVLGGHFALKCYLDYRPTHDLDGWWSRGLSSSERHDARSVIRQVATEVANEHGLSIVERSWGDTEALDFQRPTPNSPQTVFSVQIAERTVELDPPITSPWPPIPIETLRDNLASKMNALVARGAPRDFRDVYEVVRADLATITECWELWQAKNADLRVDLAKAQVVKHLESIALRRPLGQLGDRERAEAQALRQWVLNDLVSGLDLPGAHGGTDS
jgi:predicted nucleotidyltransferase component of viral defense system